MDQARREAGEATRVDPNNAQAFLQWGAALLELAQAQNADKAKEMVEESIVRLKRCLELKPEEHKALWCLGQDYHALGFMTERRDQAETFFAEMTVNFAKALELDPTSPLYKQSIEQAKGALDLWLKVQEQIRAAMGGGGGSGAPVGGTGAGAGEIERAQPSWDGKSGSSASFKSTPRVSGWMGIKEETWVEVGGWVAAASIAAGLLFWLNRAAPPQPGK